jgi:RNase adaptor protein for sRNA GlmZ degradation
MKTVTFTRELYLNWSNEDLRKRYEFLMEREQSLGPQLLHNLEIVSEILMEREALEMSREITMTVPDAMKLIVENLTPNGNQKLEDAQSVIINALNLTQIDQPFGFKE